MRAFFKQLFSQKREVNYLYFSFFLLFLSSLSLYHYMGRPTGKISLFFLFYSVGQAFLEVSVFVLIGYMLKRWAPRWIHQIFISTSFLFLLIHFTDFLMVRILDLPVSYLFPFFFGSGIDHIVAGFQALNFNWTMIGLTFGSFALIPILGLGFYWLTYRLAEKKPLHLSFNQILIAVSAIFTALFLLDLMIHPFLNSRTSSKYQKTLPLGTMFLSPSSKLIPLPKPLAAPRNEEETLSKIPEMSLTHLPNIYFFVVETFRKDFLGVAPHLTLFGEENIQIPSSFSNANSSMVSWFSLFHSDFPFHWTRMRNTWKKGSIPLQFLKKLGYQINVYTSADLRYFGMDKLIFGEKRQLADSIEEYTYNRTLQPCDRDALALQSLSRDLAPEGHVYLIFLDSPHSEYSFPDDFPIPYEPICKEIDYLTIGPKSPELECIKNRYRNSLYYVDSLLGNFFHLLKEKNLFDDAIISVTGDHGEEFFEEGALFHSSHLNHYQTSVPILLKFPSKDWLPQTQEATHIDLFPSILHYLTHESHFPALFDGKSIFSPARHPFRIAVHQNGFNPPTEFLLTNSHLHLHARWISPEKLEIIELQGFLESDTIAPLLTE